MRLRWDESSIRSVRAGGACMLLMTASFACNDDALIRDYNDLPLAVAQLVRPDTGEILEPLADGSLAPVTLPYAGAPVRVLLRGENSRDPDGTLREYRWLSATRIPDAGVLMPPLRRVPPGADSSFPADEPNVTLELEQGTWGFTLWVRDDDGAWSAPDTVRVVIGSAPTLHDGGVSALSGSMASMDGGPPTLVR